MGKEDKRMMEGRGREKERGNTFSCAGIDGGKTGSDRDSEPSLPRPPASSVPLGDFLKVSHGVREHKVLQTLN